MSLGSVGVNKQAVNLTTINTTIPPAVRSTFARLAQVLLEIFRNVASSSPKPQGKGQLGIHARCGSADNFQPDGRGQVLHSSRAAGLIQKGRTSFSTV